MSRSGSTWIRRVLHSFVLPPIILAVCSGLFVLVADSQGSNGPSSEEVGHTLEGYVTAVHPPHSFDVNGRHVTTSPETLYGLFGDKAPRNDSPFRESVQVGAFVRVEWATNTSAKTAPAASVLFRDGLDKKLEGFGVIDRVIAPGPEPVFQVDGYRIRIASDTATTFSGGLTTVADVGTNTWVKYEGKRDKAGLLIATQAKFVPARQGKIKPVPQQDAVPSQDSLIDANGNFLSMRAKVRLSDAGGVCGWHRFPADNALQERIRRVGMSVVPAYQKQLAEDSPSKIHFRFYAVDEAKIRSEFFCNAGLILVPKQMVERLKSDDQLAALLADGVAYNIQLQSARLIAEWRELFGAELAGMVAEVFIHEVYFANEVGGDIVAHKIEMQMQEQRGRIALALLADSGYDPRQAPETWRLIVPKHLPRDESTLKYPNRSWYQLSILNLQYGTNSARESVAPDVPVAFENK